MSSSNNDEEYKWPESGNAGPDVEWEGDVPIEIPEIPGPAETPTLPPISPGTEDQGKDAGDQTKEDQVAKDAGDGDEDETKEDQVATKEDEEIPTVEEYMKQEEAEQEDESLPTGSLPTTPQRRPNIQIPPSPLTPLSQSPPPSTRPKMKVSTLERYYPSPQEVKETFPENLDELFEKHGDDLIIQDDENGKAIHIFFLFGEYEGKKHYRCIKKGCNSFLLVKEIPKPGCPSHFPLPNQQKVRTPKGKGKKKEKADEDPQERCSGWKGCSKEDQKENEENVKDESKESKGAIPKKRKPKKKKSNKKGKNKKKMYK